MPKQDGRKVKIGANVPNITRRDPLVGILYMKRPLSLAPTLSLM
jgi:hypothetical protein